jgi:hypothetical protein
MAGPGGEVARRRGGGGGCGPFGAARGWRDARPFWCQRRADRQGVTGVDRARREAYLYGWCGELAAALAALSGWRVVEVRHAGVLSPDGRWFLDAAGMHEAGPLFAAVPGPGPDQARADAAALLRHLGVRR